MKQTVILFISVFWLGFSLYSQVVINQSDMPVAGDTLRVSATNIIPVGYSKTAMDTTWDFAALEALSQRVDTFVSATATPWAYQLFFGGANLASPRSGSPVPGLSVSHGFTFFKNSSTSFNELGSAYTIQGIPLSAKYDNPDKYYEFPMQPGLMWSSTASFSIEVPNLLYFSTQRFRTNVVDGWGTLITPYGTFQTLRVKSTLLEHDSIYIDSLSTGFPFNRNIIEYKWLGKEQGVPLLQVNEEGSLVITTYRDFYRMPAQPLSVTLGPDTAVFMGTSITLHAMVSGGTPPYQILWSTLDTGNTLTITVQNIKTYSVVVIDAMQNFASAQKIVSIKYPPGIDEPGLNPELVYPNPTQGNIHISLLEKCAEAEVQVFTLYGKKMYESVEYPVNRMISANLSGLPNGLYFVRIASGKRIYFSKVQVIR